MDYKKILNLPFTPDVFQTAILDESRNGNRNILINAVAGSGKTTTILWVSKLLQHLGVKDMVFLAFNRAIVVELKKKLDGTGVYVTTSHGFGLSVIKNHIGETKAKNLQIDSRKYRSIIEEQAQNWDFSFAENEDERQSFCDRVFKLVNLGRQNLSKNQQDLALLADKFEIDVFDGELTKVFGVIAQGQKNLEVIDYVDMIYLPVALSMRVKNYSRVFVDECQDLNLSQQALVNMIRGQKGISIIVGDPFQAIYGFAGADSESFERLRTIPNTVELPLSCCFRCPVKVVKIAQKIVPHITWKESAEEGEYRFGKPEEIQSGDMVLCRLNAPLVKMCLEFLAKKKKAYIKGGDIGKDIANMVKKHKAKDMTSLLKKLQREVDKKIQKLMTKKGLKLNEAMEHSSVLAEKQKVDVIQAIAEGISDPTPKKIEEVLLEIFKDESDGICFSSIHRSKGLECPRVFVIMPSLVPFPKAKQPWQVLQEMNLKYVMLTRAMESLIVIDEKDWTYKKD